MKRKVIGVIALYCCVAVIEGVIVKNEPKGDISKEKGIIRSKECTVAEECRRCTFDELKHDLVCAKTSFKERHHCVYDNNEEEYYSELCEGKKRINSVYVMLCICIALIVVVWRFQKSQKESVLKNIFNRLSLFQDSHRE